MEDDYRATRTWYYKRQHINYKDHGVYKRALELRAKELGLSSLSELLRSYYYSDPEIQRLVESLNKENNDGNRTGGQADNH